MNKNEIVSTVSNAPLQLAIYTATGRLINKRKTATDSSVLPQYQALRTAANALKRHTMDHLDHYLEQFEAQVAAHGGKVIYCQTGEAVADFVLKLAKERGAGLLVKSKSMTTEEVDLNERLEHHHLEAVETDLGDREGDVVKGLGQGLHLVVGERGCGCCGRGCCSTSSRRYGGCRCLFHG